MIETVLTCPLGHKCEEVREGKIHRCAWFVEMAGSHPSTGETLNEKGCAMAWTPVLLVENARVARGNTQAIESFRNQMGRANATLLSAALIGPGLVPQEPQNLLEG